MKNKSEEEKTFAAFLLALIFTSFIACIWLFNLLNINFIEIKANNRVTASPIDVLQESVIDFLGLLGQNLE